MPTLFIKDPIPLHLWYDPLPQTVGRMLDSVEEKLRHVDGNVDDEVEENNLLKGVVDAVDEGDAVRSKVIVGNKGEEGFAM